MDGLIQMLPAPLRQFSTHHDFPGQKRAERTYQVILVVSGIIGFFVGYYTQQLSHSVFCVLAGGVLAAWQPNIEETKKDEGKKGRSSN